MITPQGGQPSGMPLALRLGLVLSAAVLVVLLVAGAAVNRVVSGQFEDVVSAQQTEQVQAAADALSELLRQGGRLVEARTVLERLSHNLGAEVRVLGPRGQEIARVGMVMPPGAPSHEISADVMLADQAVATVFAEVPTQESTDRPFLGVFNAVLLVGGLVAVAVIAGLSVWIARRQTRPLHDVALAAARLEAGDLTARATGGGDRESQELAGAFNSMAARLQRSEMLRRRAASDMAHDLATPATVLESQLQAMVDGVIPKTKSNLEAARATSAALGSVVVQLGDLASAEAAPLQARPERLAIATVLSEAAAALDGLYRDRGVALRVEAPPPELRATADPVHLGRALRNVMTNAAQYSPSGSTVRVEAVQAGERVEIRVIDQGPGIPAEDLPHIFERFYRSDPARSAQPGAAGASGAPGAMTASAGIGLTIARELLAPSSGSIAVERTGSGGTTLLISLRA